MGDFSVMELSAGQLKVDYEEYNSTVEKQERQVQYTATKAGQILVSYVLFVAVMFSSLTSSSSSFVLRRIRWVLFSQMLLISTSFGFVIYNVIKGLLQAKYHYEQSLMVRDKLFEEMCMAQNGEMKNPERQKGGWLVKPDPVRLRRWYTNLFAIVSPLMAFTALSLYASFVILHDGR